MPPRPTLGTGTTKKPQSAKTMRTVLDGPIPEEGSGQDRFLQYLNEARRKDSESSKPVAQRGAGPTSPKPPLAMGRVFTAPVSKQQDAIHTERAHREKAQPPQLLKKESVETLPARPNNARKGNQGRRDHRGGRERTGLDDIRNHPLVTARLSGECQSRGFNPHFHEVSSPNGFTCDVDIAGKMIHGENVYSSAMEAKKAVAHKAISYVQRLPKRKTGHRSAEVAAAPAQPETADGGQQERPGKMQMESPFATTAPVAREAYGYPPLPATNMAYNWGLGDHSNGQGDFFHRVQSAMGGSGPSPAVLTDPIAAQAFLQGLVVGTAVRSTSSPYASYEPRPRRVAPAGDFYPPYDIRERSPTRRSRQIRERSPPGRRPH
ncbi:hypothetical protein GGS20DRAFT_244747 [Poronia punctata]|nr:hypothetical protein GGS20DRAFT_244747 [Poronia punctata]